MGRVNKDFLSNFSKCGGGSETPKTERVIVTAKSSNDLLRNGTVTNWKLFRTARGRETGALPSCHKWVSYQLQRLCLYVHRDIFVVV